MPRARGSLILVMALVACAAMKSRDDQSRLAEARALLLRGSYDSAAAEFGRLASSSDSGIARSARLHHVRALAERGRYDEAESAARRYGGPDLLVPLGDIHRLRGRLSQADSAYAQARRSNDSLTAALRLGELRLDRGDRAASSRVFDRSRLREPCVTSARMIHNF
jgi:tetratricopeptide (TPR) repeat protein